MSAYCDPPLKSKVSFTSFVFSMVTLCPLSLRWLNSKVAEEEQRQSITVKQLSIILSVRYKTRNETRLLWWNSHSELFAQRFTLLSRTLSIVLWLTSNYLTQNTMVHLMTLHPHACRSLRRSLLICKLGLCKNPLKPDARFLKTNHWQAHCQSLDRPTHQQTIKTVLGLYPQAADHSIGTGLSGWVAKWRVSGLNEIIIIFAVKKHTFSDLYRTCAHSATYTQVDQLQERLTMLEGGCQITFACSCRKKREKTSSPKIKAPSVDAW